MPALLTTLLCAAELLLFLLPGFAVAIAISLKRELRPADSLIATITSSAAFGYIAFWIYFRNKAAGQVFSYGIAASAIITLAIAFRRKRSRVLCDADSLVPIAYALCLGLFYASLLYLFTNPTKAGVDVANVRFFPDTRAGDNIIPFIFAQRIYDRAPIRPFCCGDWLSSDRPPLQAGIFLMQRPLRVAGNTGLQYQVLGTMLQCLWVCGVWTLLRELGAQRTRVTQALGLLAFSGFLFYNSVYVWPKLLAASFILFVFAILARVVLERRALTRLELVLVSMSFVLALLAHPGSVFSAPAITVLLFIRRTTTTVRQVALAALIVIGAIVPWTLYQKLYDPPGNRLLKMHLAGAIPPDERSTLETLRDSYGRLNPATIAEYKWANIRTLIGPAPFAWRGAGARLAQREFMWNALGVLNLGWIAGAVLWARRKPAERLPEISVMIGAALINLLVWCVVMFGPGQTVTEHGSYADILLLSLGLISFLLVLPPVALTVLMAAQALNLMFVWVSFRPASFTLPSRAVVQPTLQWPMLILAACVGGVLFWRFTASYFRRDSTPPIADSLFQKKPQ